MRAKQVLYSSVKLYHLLVVSIFTICTVLLITNFRAPSPLPRVDLTSSLIRAGSECKSPPKPSRYEHLIPDYISCDDKLKPTPRFDAKRFNDMFDAEFRESVRDAIKKVMAANPSVSGKPFWHDYPNWETNNYVPASVPDLRDLFGPNYGILHYLSLIPEENRPNLRVIEYACGLGQLQVYILRMGFKSYTCVEVFSQSDGVNIAQDFAKEIGVPINVVDKIPEEGADIYIHASIYWTIKDMVSILSVPSIRMFAMNDHYQIRDNAQKHAVLTFDKVLAKFEFKKIAVDKDWGNSLWVRCSQSGNEYPKHFSYAHSFHRTPRSEKDIIDYYNGKLKWKP